jgi:hypothetical protein
MALLELVQEHQIEIRQAAPIEPLELRKSIPEGYVGPDGQVFEAMLAHEIEEARQKIVRYDLGQLALSGQDRRQIAAFRAAGQLII